MDGSLPTESGMTEEEVAARRAEACVHVPGLPSGKEVCDSSRCRAGVPWVDRFARAVAPCFGPRVAAVHAQVMLSAEMGTCERYEAAGAAGMEGRAI